MTCPYNIYDVFTDRPLAGNALAVVFEADGLDAAAMQAVAREFNLSETVFLHAADNPAHSARARIFTPARELPFAGHPTVGAAVALTQERFGTEGRHDAMVVLEEAIGLVRCGVSLADGRGFAEFDAPKLPERLADGGPRDGVADTLGLTSSEIGFENHAPTVWSAGNAFAFVPVADRGVLARVSPAPTGWAVTFGEAGAFVYTRETEGHEHHFRARMFAPGFGLAEDPATGSAVCAFAGVIHLFDDLPDGEHGFVIEQGFEMGRPSLIHLTVGVERGAVDTVRVGGHAVRVMSGTISV